MMNDYSSFIIHLPSFIIKILRGSLSQNALFNVHKIFDVGYFFGGEFRQREVKSRILRSRKAAHALRKVEYSDGFRFVRKRRKPPPISEVALP